MLGDIASDLTRVAGFFGFETDSNRIEAVADGPLIGRYSKDLSFDYSPTLRRDLIEQELRLQPRDIAGALAMLHTAAEKSPLVARALTRAED